MIWILVVLVTIFLAVVAMLTVGILISGPRYKGPVSDHFEGSRFVNPGGAKAKGGLEVFKWMFTRKLSRRYPNYIYQSFYFPDTGR
jgi:hypothetical protein